MISKSLVAASSRPLILGILRKHKTYGYSIISQVKELSGGAFKWSDGMLYPVLHKLEKEKLIESEWVLSEEGRHRKYYKITEKGKQSLLEEKKQWALTYSTLSKIWSPQAG